MPYKYSISSIRYTHLKYNVCVRNTSKKQLTGCMFLTRWHRFTSLLVPHDPLISTLFLEWVGPKAGCPATTILLTKHFLCDCDLLDKCRVPVYVSFPEHTWQPEGKQKCKAPNACCEIYALKPCPLLMGRLPESSTHVDLFLLYTQFYCSIIHHCTHKAAY